MGNPTLLEALEFRDLLAEATAVVAGARQPAGANDRREHDDAQNSCDPVSARLLVVLIGSRERAVQPCDPVQLQAVAAPVVERASQVRTLVAVEFDRPACPDGFELYADFLGSGCEGEFLEQHVALVPGHLDGLAGYVDPYSVESAAFHAKRAYIEVAARASGC
jgi:hypothetical protein